MRGLLGTAGGTSTTSTTTSILRPDGSRYNLNRLTFGSTKFELDRSAAAMRRELCSTVYYHFQSVLLEASMLKLRQILFASIAAAS